MTTRHPHRALSQVELALVLVLVGGDSQDARHSWIQQIGNGTPSCIRAEWSKARRGSHSGLMQRTSAVYAI